MKPKHSRSGFATPIIRNLVAVLCSVVLVPGDIGLLASQAPSQVAAAADVLGRHWRTLEAEPTEALLRQASRILDRYTRSVR